MKLKIAFLQITPASTLQENLVLGERACREAKKRGADIALFPEMFNCGYDIYDRPPALWQKDAVSSDGEFVRAFASLAKELDMAIAITYLEAWQGPPRNTVTLFDRHGEKKLSYAKVHTCDFGPERNLTRGEDFFVTQLDTAKGPLSVGAMICYDREFPESARILMLRGAELVLVPNACPMEINRLSQLRGRAYENMMAIATCNYPVTVPDCNGGSTLFDGVAYLPELSGSRDTMVFSAPEEEGVYVAELDVSQLRSYRAEEVHGNAYRRPKLYAPLTEEKIQAPFLRSDRRK